MDSNKNMGTPKKTGLNMVQYPKNQFGSLSSGSSIYIYIICHGNPKTFILGWL